MALTLSNTIEEGSEISAAEHEQNYNEIEAYINGQLLHKDGSVAMDPGVQFLLGADASAANAATTKAQMEAADAAVVASAATDATSKANAAQAAAIATAAADATAKADAAAAGSAASAWTGVSLLNGWQNFTGRQAAQYRKRADEVQLRGQVRNGSVSTDIHLFTLPAGFRPPADLSFPIASAVIVGESPRMFVKSNGECRLFGITANTDVSWGFAFSTSS